MKKKYRGSTVVPWYRPTLLCMLDISKAFDKVNNYCMFIKLMNRNVPVVLLKVLISLTSMINVLCLFVGIMYYRDVFI